MKRYILTLIFLLAIVFESLAQSFILSELPYRGIPKAMYKTKYGSFITVFDVKDSLNLIDNPVLMKHNSDGNLLNMIELSPGLTTKIALLQVAYFDSTIIYLYVNRLDSGNMVYQYDTSLNLIFTTKIKACCVPWQVAKINSNKFNSWNPGNIAGELVIYDSLFNQLDSIILPSIEFKEFRRSKRGFNIITNGPDNPNFPTSLYYYVYNDSLQLVANKVYQDKDHIPFALDDGWLFYRDGLFRVNNSLDSIWYKPPSTYKISGFTVQEVIDLKRISNGYIMAGQMFNSIFATTFIIKTDSFGNVIYKNKIPLFADKVVSIEERADGKFVLFASGYPDNLNRDKLLLLLVNADGTLGISDNQNRLESSIKVFPNPIVDQATIAFIKPFVGTVKLYSIEGKLILEESLNAVEQYEMNTGSLTSGVYILTIENSEGKLQKKLIKQ